MRYSGDYERDHSGCHLCMEYGMDEYILEKTSTKDQRNVGTIVFYPVSTVLETQIPVKHM
jgi:hypothetical protein